MKVDKKHLDNIGQTIGVLKIVGVSPVGRFGARYICICECGKERKVFVDYIDKTYSCGCVKRPKPDRRYLDKSGYVMLKMPEHPKSDSNGYILEHRYKMEIEIGRRLESWEQVHHKNTIRNDNRIENLEIWVVGRQPSGGRVQDLIEYAEFILKKYAPEKLI